MPPPLSFCIFGELGAAQVNTLFMIRRQRFLRLRLENTISGGLKGNL